MDIYDKQIQRLRNMSPTNFKHAIDHDWTKGIGLFKYLGDSSMSCGCTTMVKQNVKLAFNNITFTNWIRAQDIPDNVFEIEKHHLPIFAEIQRRADREFRNQGGQP